MRHYFFACHWEAQHDPAKQRECLDKAGKADPDDVDVLIARYRLPDQPRGYHAKIVERSSGPPLRSTGRSPPARCPRTTTTNTPG